MRNPGALCGLNEFDLQSDDRRGKQAATDRVNLFESQVLVEAADHVPVPVARRARPEDRRRCIDMLVEREVRDSQQDSGTGRQRFFDVERDSAHADIEEPALQLRRVEHPGSSGGSQPFVASAATDRDDAFTLATGKPAPIHAWQGVRRSVRLALRTRPRRRFGSTAFRWCGLRGCRGTQTPFQKAETKIIFPIIEMGKWVKFTNLKYGLEQTFRQIRRRF